MFGKSKGVILAGALLAGTSLGSTAQTVTPLTKGTTYDGIIYGWQLMDGSLLFQGGLLQDFYRFRPDKSGSYLNGTFYLAASLPPDYVPYATSGGVLPDGRVLLIGGEYTMSKAVTNGAYHLEFDLTRKMAVYDPVKDTWTPVNSPDNFPFIGDSPWTLLADGRLLLGDKLNDRDDILDPNTLKWSETANIGKQDVNAEEGFTLLPNGSVLTVNMTDHDASPNSQRFIPNDDPALTRWVGAGTTPQNLQATDTNGSDSIVFDHGKRVYHPPGEIGPAILRPDGTVFATGAACTIKGPNTDPDACVVYHPVGHTAVYNPANPSNPWTAGPNFPHGEGAGDSYASLLPNGNVLVQPNPPGVSDAPARVRARYANIRAGTIRPSAEAPQSSCPPTELYRMYEFDGAKLIPEPQATFCGEPSMLLLPTGQVMLGGQYAYTTSGTYQQSWRPTITKFTQTLAAGGNYQIWGTQFNGLSQANAYGDEFQVSTNYPLVRITNNASGHVQYARAYNPSTMGVATGAAIVSTWFEVPTNSETGDSALEVVANGIPSLSVNVTIVRDGP